MSGNVNATLIVDANGYTDLPTGKLATLVTSLEMTARPPVRAVPELPGLTLDRWINPAPDAYRQLFAAVGEPYLWFSRRVMPGAQLLAILRNPLVEVYVPRRDGVELGLVELDRRTPGEIELAYFGLVPSAVGSGVGRWLMDRAIDIAWSYAPRRFWVHTCAFDHPGALSFYRRSGFVPYKLSIEIGDDPRLTGHLPRSSAPQIPLIG